MGIAVRLGWVTALKRGTSMDIVNFEAGLGL